MPDWGRNYYNHLLILLFNIQYLFWNVAPCLSCLPVWRFTLTKKLNWQHLAHKWSHILMKPTTKSDNILQVKSMYFNLLLQSWMGWQLYSQNPKIFPSLLHVDEYGKNLRADSTYKYDDMDINFTIRRVSFALLFQYFFAAGWCFACACACETLWQQLK